MITSINSMFQTDWAFISCVQKVSLGSTRNSRGRWSSYQRDKTFHAPTPMGCLRLRHHISSDAQQAWPHWLSGGFNCEAPDGFSPPFASWCMHLSCGQPQSYSCGEQKKILYAVSELNRVEAKPLCSSQCFLGFLPPHCSVLVWNGCWAG